MFDRIYDFVLDRVHAIPVIPFFSGLAWSIMSQVRSRVDFVVDFVVVTPPVSDLHLIMSMD